MNYLIIQNFFDSILSLVLQHRVILGIIWFFLVGFFLWKLSKKDNDFVLKDFFKKNNYFLLTKDIANK